MEFWFVLGVYNQDGPNKTKKFVKAVSGQTVGDLVRVNIDGDQKEIESFAASQSINDNDSEFVLCDPTMPVDILVDSKLKCIHVHVKYKPTGTAQDSPVINAIVDLTAISYSYLPPAREQKSRKDRLFNDIIQTLELENVKFQDHQKDLASRFVEDLCSVMWYLDPFHERFSKINIQIPPPFDKFNGYMDWKKQKKGEPQIKSVELKAIMEKLSDLMMLPWFSNDKFSAFRGKVSLLLEAFGKYRTFRDEQRKSRAPARIPSKQESPLLASLLEDQRRKLRSKCKLIGSNTESETAPLKEFESTTQTDVNSTAARISQETLNLNQTPDELNSVYVKIDTDEWDNTATDFYGFPSACVDSEQMGCDVTHQNVTRQAGSNSECVNSKQIENSNAYTAENGVHSAGVKTTKMDHDCNPNVLRSSVTATCSKSTDASGKWDCGNKSIKTGNPTVTDQSSVLSSEVTDSIGQKIAILPVNDPHVLMPFISCNSKSNQLEDVSESQGNEVSLPMSSSSCYMAEFSVTEEMTLNLIEESGECSSDDCEEIFIERNKKTSKSYQSTIPTLKRVHGQGSPRAVVKPIGASVREIAAKKIAPLFPRRTLDKEVDLVVGVKKKTKYHYKPRTCPLCVKKGIMKVYQRVGDHVRRVHKVYGASLKILMSEQSLYDNTPSSSDGDSDDENKPGKEAEKFSSNTKVKSGRRECNITSNAINNNLHHVSRHESTSSNSSYHSNGVTSSLNTPTTPSDDGASSLVIPWPVKPSNMKQASKTFPCKMCERIFSTKSGLLIHCQKIHKQNTKKFRCPQCQKCFAYSSCLSQHYLIHAGIKRYKCNICDRKFTQGSHLQQHIRTHTGEKPYKCLHTGCGKAFAQLSNLQQHSRTHLTDRPYRCNSCNMCFADEAGLREHIPKHI